MATIEKYETASGATLYRVRYRTPDNRSTQKRGFTTKREAERWANKLEVSKMTGEYVAPSIGRTTIGELGPAWLERQRGHVKPSTDYSYRNALHQHVLPRWSSTPIGAIRHSDVAAWVAELSAKRGPSTVAVCFGVLSRIMSDAVADRMLATNPATGVKLPRQVKRSNTYLTAGQLERLASESGRYRPLIWLLGTVGLRWGEAAALRVCEIDFLRRRIHLHENAVQVGGEIVVGTLKSGKSRTVPVAGFVVDELAATCEGKGRDELIWPSRNGGYLKPPGQRSWLSDAVARCQKADPTFPRITAHDLRHTAASLAISSGAHAKAVQRMLGHASAAMTLDVYADLFESDLDAVAENVAKMWPRQAGSQ